MKNLQVLFTLSSFVLCCGISQANPHPETDLSPLNENFIFTLREGTQLRPDTQETVRADGFQIQVTQKIKDKLVGVPGLSLKLSSGHQITLDATGSYKSDVFCSGQLEATARFETDRFDVSQRSGWNGGDIYTLTFSVPCEGATRVGSESKSPLASVLGIWTVVYTAQEKLRNAVGLEFWTRKTPVNYPADGAYYDGSTVNIPNGEEWDVVGHELGHAIFDQARMGRMGGGQHYIDRCYNQTLALSEGWASFFSAFVSVSLDDADARFEFMVPRRAPIQFENIPADVCPGYTNEWRVNGFLWDLVDSHQDPETLTETFAAVWNQTTGKMASGLGDMRESLLRGGFPANQIQELWNLSAGGAAPAQEFRIEMRDFISFDEFLNGH
jgi:hypothetical protein